MLINHKITYDSVMKRHLRTHFERARGNTPVISPLSVSPWNYLRCYYVRAPGLPSPPPFQKAGGPFPRHAPPFRRPWVIVAAIMLTF